MTTLNDDTVAETPRDAATVILIRDGDAGLETLLLCRGNSRTVMNQAWVFPGGKVDDSDFDHEAEVRAQLPDDPETLLAETGIGSARASALFVAAKRETHEETGVKLAISALHPWSRWVTPNEPSMMKKRFDARFFVAALPDGEIAIHDGEEATDSRWASPQQALRDYLDHNITLAPPQIMTLLALCSHPSTDGCIRQADATPTYCIQPRVIKSDQHKRILLYPGDREHPDPTKAMPGPTRLQWIDGHFEPPEGFAQFIDS